MGIKQPKVDKGLHISATQDLFPKEVFNYPVFCLKYMQKDYSLNQCEKEEKISLIERMYQLSSLTWPQIRVTQKHGFGYEKINRDAIRAPIPQHITPDISLYAFRFDGKKPMVGYITHFIFHVVYLDRDFTLYNHG